MAPKVESKYGSIATLSPENCLVSKSIQYYGEWAFNEIELIKKLIRNDGHVVDVGAHIGFHSVAISNILTNDNKVFSIEGNKDTFQILCQNTANNPNIVKINEYLSDASDKQFYEIVDNRNLGANGLAETNGAKVEDKKTVSTSTIDDFDFENISLIKIDAEGLDSKIIRGAKKLIQKQKPIIINEANCLKSTNDAFSFMVEENGYYCYFIRFEPFNRLNFKRNQIDIFGSKETECSLVFSPFEIEDMCSYEIKDLKSLLFLNSHYNRENVFRAYDFSKHAAAKIPTILAIPFFKNEHLVSEVITSLTAVRDELKKCSIEVLLLNDSPSYEPLRHALSISDTNALDVPCQILTNKKNLGYLGSANLAINMAKKSQKHLILMNSDARPTSNCISEMLQILELDEKIGFVSPRTDNCSISTIAVENKSQSVTKAFHELISPKYSRYSFSPVSPGFMLLVRNKTIVQFDNLSKDFEPGYEEENDWQLRSGKAGWRCVLANWAFAYHGGSQSFDTKKNVLSLKHFELIKQKHPHYPTLLEKYRSGNTFLSDQLIANSESKAILISCPNMNDHHDGTSRHAKELIEAFSRTYGQDYEITVLAKKDAIHFHKLDNIANVKAVTEIAAASDKGFSTTQRFFEFGLMIGQPFQREPLEVLRRSSSVIGIHMLDCIWLDIPELFSQLDDCLWESAIETSDTLFVNSEYTKKLFINRYNIDFIEKFKVNYPSLNAVEYSFKIDEKSSSFDQNHKRKFEKDYILVMGNKFPHKNLIEAAEALADKIPNLDIIAIGAERIDSKSRVKYFSSGNLSENLLDKLFANAHSIVFPSYYEGFGFPIMHALEHSKTIFVRDYELNHEIKSLLQTDKIVTFDNFDDLALTISQETFPDEHYSINTHYGWNEVAIDIVMQLIRNKHCLNQDDLNLKLESLRKITSVPRRYIPSLRRKLVTRMLQFSLINMAYKKTRRLEKILGIPATSYIRTWLKI